MGEKNGFMQEARVAKEAAREARTVAGGDSRAGGGRGQWGSGKESQTRGVTTVVTACAVGVTESRDGAGRRCYR